MGGGALSSKKNWYKLEKMGKIVWLDVSPATIGRRLNKSEKELKKRPLLADLIEGEIDARLHKLVQRLNVILSERILNYRRAHLVIADDYSEPLDFARRLADKLLNH